MSHDWTKLKQSDKVSDTSESNILNKEMVKKMNGSEKNQGKTAALFTSRSVQLLPCMLAQILIFVSLGVPMQISNSQQEACSLWWMTTERLKKIIIGAGCYLFADRNFFWWQPQQQQQAGRVVNASQDSHASNIL